MQELLSFVYRAFCIAMSLYGLFFGAVSLCCILKTKHLPEPKRRLRFAVLVAARNEEGCIAGIVESTKRQNYPPELMDIYVIPNNCTDNTESAAKHAGAKILHVSPSVRSKGQALHEAFDWLLKNENHEAYCVFDADNEAHPDFLYEMNKNLAFSRAAKSRILAKNAHEGWVCACYETYFCNANQMLNKARARLGLSARLIGTGFAVRRELMEELGGWNTSSLTEDAEFYAALAARGEHIAFAHGAITYDEEPLSFAQSITQRRRWMSGIMGVARENLPALLRRAVFGPNRRFAFDALMQLSFAWMQALAIPLFLLWAMAYPAQALDSLPQMTLSFYAGSFFAGGAALLLEGRMTKHTAAALFVYPLFIFSFLPLQTLSLFCPNKKWKPIRHSGVRLQSCYVHNK